MKASRLFFSQFLRYPTRTGAVLPSSRHLASLITEMAPLKVAKAVVEIGPGTGVFTEQILKRIGADTIFFALEINPDMARETRRRCPEATVYEDSAVHLKQYLRRHGLERCDCIVCGVPWSNLERELQNQLLAAITESLHAHGEFLTFAYGIGPMAPTKWWFKPKVEGLFESVSLSPVVWRNVPPAFVYHCRRPRRAANCAEKTYF